MNWDFFDDLEGWCLFMPSFIQQIFMEFLLYVRHCAKLHEVLNERVFVGGHTSNMSKALILLPEPFVKFQGL